MTDLATLLKPPFEITFGPDLRVRYGYKDAHVEMDVKAPIVGRVSAKFTDEEFKLGKWAFDQAKMWCDVPSYQRERDSSQRSGPLEAILSDRVKVMYGYADGHAEIEVVIVEEKSLVGKILGAFTDTPRKVIRETFTEEDIRKAQEAFEKAATWAALPAEERARIGA